MANKNSKRSRCPNFTYKEIEILVKLVEENQNELENKKTDTATNHNKIKRWMAIAAELNANCRTGRSGPMLRSKWESLKKNVRQEYIKFKAPLSGISERILHILGVEGVVLTAAHDSDSDSEQAIEDDIIDLPVDETQRAPKRRLPLEDSKETEDIYYMLAKKKLELVQLQTDMLKMEAEQKRKQSAEKHALEMKKMELEIQLLDAAVVENK